ncbi:hypothetical protein [Marivita sp. GX14005]|uniref:hypothetical protein n=1 Tax=Marivita sp. GX14005 TaxID=2942276 RepID=UPI0020187B60|nr:hypothetical protein [Marivita sp. GX14005]MCL3880935.1 hypothetical protein [Marivita sp. GX14005]
MTAFTSRALAVLALLAFTATGALAQGARSVGPPAEAPPEGYKARQYVDSRGCVYVRAGVDGAVNWVPRVSRDRRPICGQEPSIPAQPVAKAAPEIVTAPAPQRAVRGVPNRDLPNPKYTAPKRSAETRIVPLHVYTAQGDRLPPVPKGYKRAWEDDRLNPHRAHMTPEGYIASQRVMSHTVPRRSVSGATTIQRPVIVGRGKGLGH